MLKYVFLHQDKVLYLYFTLNSLKTDLDTLQFMKGHHGYICCGCYGLVEYSLRTKKTLSQFRWISSFEWKVFYLLEISQVLPQDHSQETRVYSDHFHSCAQHDNPASQSVLNLWFRNLVLVHSREFRVFNTTIKQTCWKLFRNTNTHSV